LVLLTKWIHDFHKALVKDHHHFKKHELQKQKLVPFFFSLTKWLVTKFLGPESLLNTQAMNQLIA
jgi:hypothetical protein